MTDHKPRITYIALILALIVGVWLRLPTINRNMPYFYNEDEAHHFNRLANMVKTGDLNPHYFHKPSFHFYLRIPAFVGSFFYGVSRGDIKTVDEIKTADPFGLSGYQMSTSHPVLVKGNRAFSVMVSVATILLAFLVANMLFGGAFAPSLAAWLVAVAPGLISDSGSTDASNIGVDVIVTFMSLAALGMALRIEKSEKLSGVFWAGIVAGLAVSTKYNVWPIATLPFLACLAFQRFSFTTLAVSCVAPAIGFLLGSPFILAELPLFLNHAAYEIWHYKLAGHAGHQGEPGLAQIIHYGSWLNSYGVGIGFISIILAGSIISIIKPNKKVILTVLFPFIYFLYMSSQRANFTRNMMPMVPFLAVLGAGFLWYSALLIKNNKRRLFLLITTPLLLVMPIKGAIKEYRDALYAPKDSRSVLMEGRFGKPLESELALSGNLNIEPRAYTLKNVSRIDETNTKPSTLFLQGFEHLIVGPLFAPSDEELKLLHLEQFIVGDRAYERVVINPEIRVFRFSENARDLIGSLTALPQPTCAKEESYCWISTLMSEIPFNISGLFASKDTVKIPIQVMTPWNGQEMKFSIADWSKTIQFKPEDLGHWVDIELELPLDKLALAKSFKCEVKKVHSPKALKVGEDPRRLGVAIKSDFLEMR